MKNIDEPLVSIICPTFNHENYIKECLEGFVSQITNFVFEIIVHDDASTDKTVDIIKEYASKYPHLFKNIYQTENQFSKQISSVTKIMFEKAKGKYLALCEGDDFWSDPHKLQKQVEFLELNKDFTVCWTDYVIKRGEHFEKNEWETEIQLKSNKIINLNNFGYPYCTYSLTTCLKKEVLDNINLNKFKHFKDNTLYVLALLKGNGMLMNTKTSVYRKHSSGIYSLNSYYAQWLENYFNLSEILILTKGVRNEHFAFLFRYTKSELKNKTVKFSKEYFKVKLLILKFYFELFFTDIHFLSKVIRK